MKLHTIFLEQTINKPQPVSDPSTLRAVPTSPSSVVQLDDPNYKGKRRGDEISNFIETFDLDTHEALEVVGLVAIFFPPIGTAISVAAGLVNAGLYAKEGDNYSAGLNLMFSTLPLIGPIVNKIPGLKTWSKKALITLGEKIKLKQALTKGEKLLADQLILNKDFIKTEVNNLIVKSKDKILKSALDGRTKQFIIKTAEKGGDLVKAGTKITGNVTTTGASILIPGEIMVSGYDKLYGIVQSDTPRSVAEKMGYDWEELKDEFGSSNTPEDNIKLKNALLTGWNPSEDEVPKIYRTELYAERLQTPKTLSKEELENEINKALDI